MTEPRAKTAEEVRAEFLAYVHNTARYWAGLPDKTPQEMCDGLAFSILCVFDGEIMALPALDIALAPHPSDKQYYIDHNENWYEEGMIINDDCMLNEEFVKHD